ncbi:hypothetical protein GXW82_26870 [Streptacidiphilus sp. 4-A2]|nr:hypothetical protein [Streptacidiphilus sp. 4-A2]
MSHPHIDHVGLAGFLREDVAVHAHTDAVDLLEALSATGQGLTHGDPVWRRLADGQRTQVGPMEVECVLVDHDVPGASGYLVRTSAGTLAFTGDIRFHGHHPERAWDFVDRAAGCEVLATEGTTLGWDMSGPLRTRTTSSGTSPPSWNRPRGWSCSRCTRVTWTGCGRSSASPRRPDAVSSGPQPPRPSCGCSGWRACSPPSRRRGPTSMTPRPRTSSCPTRTTCPRCWTCRSAKAARRASSCTPTASRWAPSSRAGTLHRLAVGAGHPAAADRLLRPREPGPPAHDAGADAPEHRLSDPHDCSLPSASTHRHQPGGGAVRDPLRLRGARAVTRAAARRSYLLSGSAPGHGRHGPAPPSGTR